MHIFIDDMRENPYGTILCTSLAEFSILLNSIESDEIESVDFDFFLQEETGKECILYLYDYCVKKSRPLPPASFHSSSRSANEYMHSLYEDLKLKLK